jgi:hypothetical protein
MASLVSGIRYLPQDLSGWSIKGVLRDGDPAHMITGRSNSIGVPCPCHEVRRIVVVVTRGKRVHICGMQVALTYNNEAAQLTPWSDAPRYLVRAQQIIRLPA